MICSCLYRFSLPPLYSKHRGIMVIVIIEKVLAQCRNALATPSRYMRWSTQESDDFSSNSFSWIDNKVFDSLLCKYISFQRNREAGSTPRSIFQCFFFIHIHASKWSQIDLFLSFRVRFYCLKLIWMCLWVLCRSFSKRTIKTCKSREKKYTWRERRRERHRRPPGGNFSPST